MTDEPRLRLAEGQRLLDASDPEAAIRILASLTGHPDRELATEAWLGIGTARYRLDDEHGALAAWQQAAALGGSNAWLGWKSVAEQNVRDGNLEEAVAAYREADRRAPGIRARALSPTASPGSSRRRATTSPPAASSTGRAGPTARFPPTSPGA